MTDAAQPKAVKPNLHGQNARDVRECFGDDDTFDAWRMRWARSSSRPATWRHLYRVAVELTGRCSSWRR